MKYIAKKFNRETNYKFKEEFYQAGLLGLAKALSKFDHEKMFEKILFSAVERFYEAVQWRIRKPREAVQTELFDLFG